MKVLVFGGTGLLGSELKDCLIKSKHEVVTPTRTDFDVNDGLSIEKIIKGQSFDFIINCLAEISVEKCELNSDLAYRINGDFPVYILNAIRGAKVKFIHISTSDVFTNSNDFIRDTDIPIPPNIYGASKLLAETNITKGCLDYGIDYNIIRVGWMYGKNKNNFVNKLKSTLLLDQSIEVINDQYNIPVYNKDFAECITKIVHYNKVNNKILHFSSFPPEKVSKFDIALEVCNELKKNPNLIIPKSKKDIFKVNRPDNVCLRPSHELTCHYWKESLLNYLRNDS